MKHKYRITLRRVDKDKQPPTYKIISLVGAVVLFGRAGAPDYRIADVIPENHVNIMCQDPDFKVIIIE